MSRRELADRWWNYPVYAAFLCVALPAAAFLAKEFLRIVPGLSFDRSGDFVLAATLGGGALAHVAISWAAASELYRLVRRRRTGP